ncbi:hypothetical protein EPIR_2696 [Erwinia piriflorinigrans CFBP 5888]|uniref:Uncharacterized protein n=1 Tax=Erwinia piriflorinigrans CFBP 5888 TaxID=1161919 RepID=V5ZAT5_9GAMM|nr:hypothetical protein EPIR_2696 [Erwinia piriflorinigrans CFBP 5888]
MTNGIKPGIGSCYSPERAEHAKRRPRPYTTAAAFSRQSSGGA